MAYYPATPFVPQFTTDTGVPLSGGSITAYVAGTTTPTPMYIDADGTSAGTVVSLNACGEPVVSTNTVVLWLDSAVTYKFVLKDASGSSKWTIDDIANPMALLANETNSSLGGSLVGYYDFIAPTYLKTVSDILNGLEVSAFRFIPPAQHAGIRDATNAYDASSNLQDAADALIAAGGTLLIPAGSYKSSTEILIDYSANTSETTLNKFSIRGEGMGNTQLTFTGAASQGLRILGGATDGLHSYQKISGLRLQGNGTASMNGMTLDNLAFFALEDLLITGFTGNFGLYATDLLSTVIQNVIIRANKYGLYCERSNASYPNAIALIGVDLGLNVEYGGYIKRPTTLTYTGGSIQGNGLTGVASDRWGIKVDSAGGEGAAGISFDGVYFEYNTNRADAWIDHAVSNAATYSFDGCTFNRIDSTNYVTNNIRCDVSDGKVQLVAKGNGFKGFGTYTEDAARKYVTLTKSGGASNFIDIGNIYDSSVARPAITGPVRGDIAGASAYIRFNGTAGTTAQAFNATLVKNGTGDYSINYDIAMTTATNCYSFTLATVGYLEIFSESTGGVRIITKNSSGNPTDFDAICLIVHGGAGIV